MKEYKVKRVTAYGKTDQLEMVVQHTANYYAQKGWSICCISTHSSLEAYIIFEREKKQNG